MERIKSEIMIKNEKMIRVKKEKIRDAYVYFNIWMWTKRKSRVAYDI